MKTIGYWGNTPESVQPINKNWKIENSDVFEKVKDFLNPENVEQNGFKVLSYKGISICRICSEWNGSREYVGHGLIIPQGYLHYITEHGLIPDQSLIELISKKGI